MRFQDLIPWTRGQSDESIADDHDPLYALQGRMNQLFNDFVQGFELGPFGGVGEGSRPRIDVVETPEEIRVQAELPGVDPKDVDVSLSEGVLTISGEKRTEEQKDGEDYRRVERSFGRFQRTFTLPCAVSEDAVEADFENGVLSVRLPKAPEAKARTRRIEVRSGR